MVAAIGAGEVFTKGRDFAAWLGLVPKPARRRRSERSLARSRRSLGVNGVLGMLRHQSGNKPLLFRCGTE